jgi:aryl-alcohol dehydrogenase-like predicted oxidoreductase
MKRLIIGTANFDNDYGILNNKLSKKEIEKVLKFCFNNRIKTIDSAPTYGKAEKIIGNFLQNHDCNGVDLISKTPLIFKDDEIYEKINKSIETTLNNMKLEKIHTLLIHSVSNFLEVNPSTFLESLLKLKSEGKIKKIGISIYEEKEFNAIAKFFIPDVVQLPISIIDQRFLSNKFLTTLKKKKCEIHARSIFFQGLLFLDSDKIPKNLLAIKGPILLIDRFCKQYAVTRLNLILNFICSIKEIDAFVVGVKSKGNLVEVFKELCTIKLKRYKIPYNNFFLNNPKILDARNWS